MKGIVILMFVFSMLVSATTVSPPPDFTIGNVILPLWKGWNIVPYGYYNPNLDLVNIGSNCTNETVVFWSPTLNKYIVAGPNIDDNSSTDLDYKGGYLYATSPLGGAWVYITSDCVKTYKFKNDGSESARKYNRIKKGWQFVTIMPWMVNKTFSKIFENCIISKTYTWDGYTQKWSTVTAFIKDNTFVIGDEYIGIVLVTKFENDCVLTVAGSSKTPPPLPK